MLYPLQSAALRFLGNIRFVLRAMDLQVTTMTQRNDLSSVFIAVTIVVMIFAGGFTTLNTLTKTWWGNFPRENIPMDSFNGSILNETLRTILSYSGADLFGISIVIGVIPLFHLLTICRIPLGMFKTLTFFTMRLQTISILGIVVKFSNGFCDLAPRTRFRQNDFSHDTTSLVNWLEQPPGTYRLAVRILPYRST